MNCLYLNNEKPTGTKYHFKTHRTWGQEIYRDTVLPRRIKNVFDMKAYYVYVLLSERDNKFYTGYTNNLEKRVGEHNNGEVYSTKMRRPLKLIYFEGCMNQQDATRREKYLKSGNGKIYLKNRLRNYFDPTG